MKRSLSRAEEIAAAGEACAVVLAAAAVLSGVGAAASADVHVLWQAAGVTAAFVAPLAAFAVVHRIIGKRDARRMAARVDADAHEGGAS